MSSVTAHLIVLRPDPSVNPELGFSKTRWPSRAKGPPVPASSTLGLRTISHKQLFTWRFKLRPSCTSTLPPIFPTGFYSPGVSGFLCYVCISLPKGEKKTVETDCKGGNSLALK